MMTQTVNSMTGDVNAPTARNVHIGWRRTVHPRRPDPPLRGPVNLKSARVQPTPTPPPDTGRLAKMIHCGAGVSDTAETLLRDPYLKLPM